MSNNFRVISPIPTVSYFLLPYKRNQDRVRIYNDYLGTIYTACVIDGWHNSELLPGNKEGQQVTELVLNTFPQMFLKSSIKNYSGKAQFIADLLNKEILERFSKHVACVGTFVFKYSDKKIIATIGTITTLVLQNDAWIKPKEIKDNKLDWKTNESGSATFFGRGELKGNKKYSNRVDTVVCSSSSPVLIFTDGADDVLDYKKLPLLLQEDAISKSGVFMKNLQQKILRHQDMQRDDITALLAL